MSQRRLLLLPVILFVGLAGLFAIALRHGEPARLPSALIGKAAPQIALPALEGLTANGTPVSGLAAGHLANGQVTVVNFWASWCAPCIEEHPLLIALVQETGVRLVGINYKDTAANARRFLGRFGNPFSAVGVDADGKAAIEWGVAGMPETFVLDGAGRILYKHVGAISAATLRGQIIPAVQRAGRAPRS